MAMRRRKEPGEGVPSGPHPGLQEAAALWALGRATTRTVCTRQWPQSLPPPSATNHGQAPGQCSHATPAAGERGQLLKLSCRLLGGWASLHKPPPGRGFRAARPNGASPRREGEELFFFLFVPQTKMWLILNLLILSILLAKGEEITGTSLVAIPDPRKPPEAR